MSDEGGTLGRYRVSEVAMSLKGMPTTILAPSRLYVLSGVDTSCAWAGLCQPEFDLLLRHADAVLHTCTR